MIRASLLSIGDELLIGQVVNTNAAWIGQQLSLNGIRVSGCLTVGDSAEEILNALELAMNQNDFVFVTGGLGPTKDDITKTCLAQFFGCSLVRNEEVLKNVLSFFARRGKTPGPLNEAQALVPEGCRVIPNPNGTAPGMWMQKENTVFISMPGVPYEMKAMMTDSVLPLIRSNYSLPAIYHVTVLTQGIGESLLAEMLESWENELWKSGISLAYLPQPGIVRLRLSAYGEDLPSLKLKIESEITKLYIIAGPYIWGREEYGGSEASLQEIVSKLLRDKKQTLSIAESCTGGYISHLMTSIPGASGIFEGSVVTYSNESKKDLLGVADDLLDTFGAVSQHCAEAMAENTRKRFNTDYALAVTGVAGPDGGTPEKPVGTVWIALAAKDGSSSQKFLFGDHRQRNIMMAAQAALNMLRKTLV